MKTIKMSDSAYKEFLELIPVYINWHKELNNVYDFSKMSKQELDDDVLFSAFHNLKLCYQYDLEMLKGGK